jgi:dimethylaniline monooxygenase (N-oxide forming)
MSRASGWPNIAADQAAMRKRYVASKRHTIQVDFNDYLYALDSERRAGVERARARGFALPVPAHAAVPVA